MYVIGIFYRYIDNILLFIRRFVDKTCRVNLKYKIINYNQKTSIKRRTWFFFSLMEFKVYSFLLIPNKTNEQKNQKT